MTEVIGNVYRALSNRLDGKGCRVYTAGMQIKVPTGSPYLYADGSVVCGQIEFETLNGCDLLVNPTLLYEVLSPSTETYDKAYKFTTYKFISSFKEYLLIAQDRPHVVHFLKRSESEWTQREYTNLSDVITLSSIDCSLPLNEIYRDVALGEFGA